MYPTSPAVAKHRLFTPPGQDLKASFASSADLFYALETAIPNDLKQLCDVYSYSDGPTPPLSRDLLVVGYASLDLPVLRKLSINSSIDNDVSLPDCLHVSKITVKRADSETARHSLPKDALNNSQAFATWIQRLKKYEIVAIVGLDKYQRFGVVQGVNASNDSSTTNSFTESDFLALTYTGTLSQVKDFLTGGSNRNNHSNSISNNTDYSNENIENDTSTSLWQPPGESTSSDGPGLWQPPGSATSTSASDGYSWQPPSTNDFAGATTTNTMDYSFNGTTNAWGVDTGNSNNDENNSSNNKRKRDDDNGDNANTFHKDSTAAAADRFYSELTRNLDTRSQSRIFHMRAFNGWVKGTQIAELNPVCVGSKPNAPLRVLDLACGKGGDLGKWTLHTRGLQNYVGSDVARGSLVDAAIRARAMRNKLKKCTFTCADLGADVPGRLRSSNHQHMQKLLTWSLQNEAKDTYGDPVFKMVRGGGISLTDKFDVVSIQFAIHYMMSTRKRARRFFQTVSELLEIGGNLIATTIDARVIVEHMMNLGLDLHYNDENNPGPDALVEAGGGACKIHFEPEIVRKIFTSQSDGTDNSEDLFGLEYSFTLIEGSDHAAGVGDAVNLPEWLTPIPVLTSLAKEAGLELEYAQNFHEFYTKRSDPAVFTTAHSALYNMKVLNRNGSLSDEEWEISRLYVAVKFRKVTESTLKMEDSDVEDEEEEADDDIEIDAVMKVKLMPQAMMKAKKSVGNDTWATFSADEKSALIELEIQKLAKQQAQK